MAIDFHVPSKIHVYIFVAVNFHLDINQKYLSAKLFSLVCFLCLIFCYKYK